jgi:protein-S-isoprenylcysteine O-methyltransferase Ste14
MQQYFAALTIVLLIALVVSRVALLRKHGIEAMKFGKLDRKDFLLPPFALFYFYLVFANAFDWPTIAYQALFRQDIAAWAGVGACSLGLAFFLWTLVSFGKSFRVGIDKEAPDALVISGSFSLSRNPIYISFGFVLFGQFLVFPSWILLLYFLAACRVIHRQVLREEEFLKQRYGDEYTAYCKKVKRYL